MWVIGMSNFLPGRTLSSSSRGGRKSLKSIPTDENGIESIEDNVVGGYLYKRGRGKTFSLHKPWSVRFVTVNSKTGILMYFESSELFDDEGLNAKGMAGLRGATIGVMEDSGKECSFQAVVKTSTGTDETMTFSASNHDLREQWISIMRDAAKVEDHRGSIHSPAAVWRFLFTPILL